MRIEDNVAVSRLTRRRICPKCGAVYHVTGLKPKVEGVCDFDGEKLVQRPADDPEVGLARFRTYHKEMAPVIKYYQGNNQIYEINAGINADEVTSVIFATLDRFVGR